MVTKKEDFAETDYIFTGRREETSDGGLRERYLMGMDLHRATFSPWLFPELFSISFSDVLMNHTLLCSSSDSMSSTDCLSFERSTE